VECFIVYLTRQIYIQNEMPKEEEEIFPYKYKENYNFRALINCEMGGVLSINNEREKGNT
jgi:hypothetical protein